MSEFFIKIINMSISASWLLLVVIVIRFFFRRVPKWLCVLLWGFVAVRLICPFSFESILSLIPSAETVSPQIMMDRTPQVTTGIYSLNAVLNPIISESFAPHPTASANPLQILIPVASIVWIAGMLLMLVYTAVSAWILQRKVATAVLWRDNIFQSEKIESPFVFGVIRPKIYLPFQMDEQGIAHVVAHEQAHIARKDHLWKIVGFLILTIHWFNPMVWIGYALLCRDIELACDERVIRNMDNENRADYAQVLVTCSVARGGMGICPLAFGEVGIKARVKSVADYKKPTRWGILFAIIICIVVAVCFLTNPATSVNEKLSVFLDCGIANRFQTEKTAGNASCVNWKVLGTEKHGSKTTIYMWVLYEEYSMDNGILRQETGVHIPTVITAERNGGAYKLVEYWIPRDGPYYEPDILEKFPWYLHRKALDSQRYINMQKPENEKLALAYFGVNAVIGGADGPTGFFVTNNGGLFSGVEKRKNLTLDDVLVLSEKGQGLNWTDFAKYNYIETGSGLYIRVYEIDGLFELWIGGFGPESDPMYMYLRLADTLDTRIDIRDGGVREFIDAHSK